MLSKKVVVYCRYSTEMQRSESCDDQERDARTGLAQKQIDCTDAVVIRDEAASGTKVARDGFQQLRGMIARGEVAVLAVDTQSRLTRAENAYAFITDLVYGRGMGSSPEPICRVILALVESSDPGGEWWWSRRPSTLILDLVKTRWGSRTRIEWVR